ncbi:MAG TPA: pentapeptide repeat-containing protein [Candidatus Nitrosopolaris sp.]|nr:pentapeptide repeat-containing protein [Candidatus Nitrosopolaris sp.]
MQKFIIVTTSLTLVVATILVAGTLLFPYNYAMAGKSHDASHSNTANGAQIGGPEDHDNIGHGNTGTANIGNGNHGIHNMGNGNTGRNNVGNGNTGSNLVTDPIPCVDNKKCD